MNRTKIVGEYPVDMTDLSPDARLRVVEAMTRAGVEKAERIRASMAQQQRWREKFGPPVAPPHPGIDAAEAQ